MCVVLSSTVNSILVDETMLDREVLLATLNIRSMYDRSFEERKRSISGTIIAAAVGSTRYDDGTTYRLVSVSNYCE
jgi:hypothetical protein